MADGLTLLLGAATIASSVMWRGEVKARRWWEQRANFWISDARHWRRQAERVRLVDGMMAHTLVSEQHALCGACGKSVPLGEDGFTIGEHGCQPELFSSTGVAQREM